MITNEDVALLNEWAEGHRGSTVANAIANAVREVLALRAQEKATQAVLVAALRAHEPGLDMLSNRVRLAAAMADRPEAPSWMVAELRLRVVGLTAILESAPEPQVDDPHGAGNTEEGWVATYKEPKPDDYCEWYFVTRHEALRET